MAKRISFRYWKRIKDDGEVHIVPQYTADDSKGPKNVPVEAHSADISCWCGTCCATMTPDGEDDLDTVVWVHMPWVRRARVPSYLPEELN